MLLKYGIFNGGVFRLYQCKFCAEFFVYFSKSGILRQIWDLPYFQSDFDLHVACCQADEAHKRTTEILGGIYP